MQKKNMGFSVFPKSVTMVIMVLCFICINSVRSVEAQSPRLPVEEVEALREIASQLGKKDWNFDVDPCLNDTSWATPISDRYSLYTNIVSCNCSYVPDGVCHVTSIVLTGQDLAGVLPPSIAKLPCLTQVSFTRNYLSGNIPLEWASTKLQNLSLTVNNLSGTIPAYLGNITTLKLLFLDSNQFYGTVPPELGKLVNLERLLLGQNNLSGELPLDLSNLNKLKVLKIGSNNFNGIIPDLFESWSQLQSLEIQASGLQGPIPLSIHSLNKLETLRISDLSGYSSSFPILSNMTLMRVLMLRSCNLVGPIPDYISKLTALRILDLSFNRLEGSIPDFGIGILDNLCLTHNALTGSIPELSAPVPDWVKRNRNNSNYYMDISYNEFPESSELPCTENLNLFKSFSAQDISLTGGCLKRYPCREDRIFVHINCGGRNTTVGGINFEGDQDRGGPSAFVPAGANWGFSNTGHFWDTEFGEDYIADNTSILRMSNSELYTNARLSPLSLTYYARCLANGSYTVRLHFSEIIIRGNRSFHSLGIRIFDVYIQEKLMLKDFNIEVEAQGVDKAVIKEFKAVEVKDKTLEIRFHWSGKGTTASPRRGVYGPLISAISIEFESTHSGLRKESTPRDSKKKVFTVAGASVLCLVFLISGILWWNGCLDSKTSREKALRRLDLQTGFFTFKQIRAATNSFDPVNKIGEGGFGSVYKGILLDGTTIAVKQLSSKSKQGNREFVNEIGMISGLQHPNLVRLYGCCIEANELLLVYEYMENNSLAGALFGPEESPLKLDWPTRQKICLGIAKGLAFLHEESALKVVHRDIKTTNVLLDKDLNAKISDFGLAKLDEEENTHISTRVAGTIGYMAPEYALWGYLTFKADVFSFGIVALEIVAGKNNMKFRPNESFIGLVDWALVLQQKESLVELVDPRLGSDFSNEEAVRMVKVALLCINPVAALRPTMSAVVSMLEGRTPVDELIMDPNIYSEEMRLTALRNPFEQIAQERAGGTQSLIHSSDASWNDSSAPTISSISI
ncbi:putative leucine-rich repeat receptor-like serine/threonine-protein kinase [Rosa sericea]